MKKTGIALLLLALVLLVGCAGKARQPQGETQPSVQTAASAPDTLSSDINEAAALTDDVDTSDMDQLDKDMDIQI
ncbi:hypothetical protein COV19_01505 [Candidatus Woesearchaeota archaeon CG10_big_fil_rev_8_21_14_0_10_44_13]|nr:MAG: hypothetical protein COV19_01505 [Candidatus Woesearchaeota archaeon CG10_big_fil_rev_8_21_14_0_10_44_13]